MDKLTRHGHPDLSGFDTKHTVKVNDLVTLVVNNDYHYGNPEEVGIPVKITGISDSELTVRSVFKGYKYPLNTVWYIDQGKSRKCVYVHGEQY